MTEIMIRTVTVTVTEPTEALREGLVVLFVAPGGGATAVLRLAATLG